VEAFSNIKPIAQMKEAKLSIGLINPKNPSNVGAVFYTGQRYPRAARFQTDTKDASQTIPLTGVDCLLDSVDKGTKVVCIELVEGATALPEYQHPENALYIFGPEDGTISQDVVDRADAVVYVPTTGCLNLAATVNVVLYDRLAKSNPAIAHDELIRQSRDTNNKVKIKNSR
jgi:tRNA(Leu) C34 or U34 (ribose-2'-O)-methylase TrmL